MTTSTPSPNASRFFRKISRTIRLNRFLRTAFPNFRVTVMPIRGLSRPLGWKKIAKEGLMSFLPSR